MRVPPPRIPWPFRKDEPPAQEGETELAPASPTIERPRVYYPSPDIGASITRFMDNLFEDVDEFSYKASGGDVAAADRLETMMMARAAFVVGLLRPLRPDVAKKLWNRLRSASARLDGMEFANCAMIYIGEGVGETMFGRKYPGVSVDDGAGLDRSGGALES